MNHSFNIDTAKKHGIEEAVFIENLIFWISKNLANKKHTHEGRTWTYNSVKAWGELFPYMTEKQIRRVLQSLEDQGVLISSNYNASAYDRTKWYAFKDESIWLKGPAQLPKQANGSAEKGEPIPDINTNINTDIITTIPGTVPAPVSMSSDLAIFTKSLWNAFTSKTNFTNYAKEGASAKKLAQAIVKAKPLNQTKEHYAVTLIDLYYYLTTSKEKFWSEQPFTPSCMLSLLDRIIKRTNGGSEIKDLSAFGGTL